jgi:hypothetical protein
VVAIPPPPGLDGAPGELARDAVFVGEGHLADGFVAGFEGRAFGVFECAEDAHFEVIGDAFHGRRETAMRWREEEDRRFVLLQPGVRMDVRCYDGNSGEVKPGEVRKRAVKWTKRGRA